MDKLASMLSKYAISGKYAIREQVATQDSKYAICSKYAFVYGHQ